MKRPNLNKWELKPEMEGLLFLAQSINELLFDYTIDTYKLPALNSRTLIVELRAALDDLESGIIKQGAIEPMAAEVVDALKKDPVMREIMGTQLEEVVKSITDHKRLHKLKTTVKYLVNKSEDSYFLTVMKLLKDTIRYPKEKEKIVRLARIYLNELISKGYATQHVYFESDRFFFSGKVPAKIDDPGLIDDYFSQFSLVDKHYQVLFRVAKNYILAKGYAADFGYELMESPPNLNFIGKSEKVDTFLGKNDLFPLFLLVGKTEAFDEFKARLIADERLFLFDSLAKYHIHRSKLSRTIRMYLL